MKATDGPNLVGLLPSEWAESLKTWGERPYRGRQVFRWLHRHGTFDASAMTNLPQSLRQRLDEEGLGAPLRVGAVRRGRDGTRKLLLDLSDGGRVECVLIPMTDVAEVADADAAAAVSDEDEEATSTADRRVTLCLSTQVGCAMGCVFCASGRAGLERGLTAAEVVAQVLVAREYLEPGEQLRNLVFMGMGEPLHHYEQTARAVRLLSHPEGCGIGLRRITVSTVGLIPGIRRLGEDFGGNIGLAISLHAPTEALRSRLIPMNRRYPLSELMEALRIYPLPRRRRITIEYTLIAGQNDSLEQARALGRLLGGLRVKVNLIPMNPIAGSSFAAPSSSRVREFREELARAGYSCFVRQRRGDEVDAACGQLALLGGSRTKNVS